MMSATEKPSVRAVAAASPMSLTSAWAGPFIVLSKAAPRLMRPFILPSSTNPGNALR